MFLIGFNMLEPRYKCIQLLKLKHYIIAEFEEGYRMWSRGHLVCRHLFSAMHCKTCALAFKTKR